jgi:hypothetical protein
VTRRITNMDETHQDLSITGDKGGSRCVSYHNTSLQQGANRGVKSARHVTGAYATTAAGGGGLPPPFYIFCSSASRKTTLESRWIVWLDYQLLVLSRLVSYLSGKLWQHLSCTTLRLNGWLTSESIDQVHYGSSLPNHETRLQSLTPLQGDWIKAQWF